MVVCLYIPRFELILAAGGPRALASQPLAIAPRAGDGRVGECSGAAEAFGVAQGMVLGEALARCPDLRLVPGDPLGAAGAWEGILASLEGMGAAVEPARMGLAYFEADGLRALHGAVAQTIVVARRAVSSATGGRGGHMGAGPTRLGALAAAQAASSRRPVILEGAAARRRLAALPIDVLHHRTGLGELVEPLQKLGLRTLGELVELPRSAIADRFGKPGLLAQELARGSDTRLEPRVPKELIQETMGVGEAGSGPMLERILGVLVDRLLARPERRGRTLRVLVLSARLVEEGTWRERVVLRQPISDATRLRLALGLRLALLPAPAEELGLAVERFGPPAGRQRSLLEGRERERHERLGETVTQLRELAGEQAALRVLAVDPDSRIPERRVVLTPFRGPTSGR
jgi:protein ImuB